MKSKSSSFFVFVIMFGLATLINAQTKSVPSKTKPVKESGTTEIADLIVYDLILYDTTKAETVGQQWAGATISDYNLAMDRRYLNVDQSRNLRNELSKLIKRKDLFYFDGNDPMSHQKVLDRTTLLYTVEQADSSGNIIGTIAIADTIDIRKWSRVTFYEEWKLNRANGMLEKTVLGYIFNWYSEDKAVWIPLFGIARDKMAQEKIKKLKGW